ncbi:MAG: M50 family metallopeptidase [Armatimonadetes bacterium]|nr:M50 family metallopeptidase [Armatimonadota bacterium]
MRKDQWALLAAGLVSVAIWMAPALRPVLWPLTLFNTHIHELCHALAALVTGGLPTHIVVNANGSGVTPVTGGLLLVVASAGYVGSAVTGGLVVAFARDEKSSRRVLATLGWVLVGSMALLVRGDIAGILVGMAWAVGLVTLAHYVRGPAASFLARFLGLQLGLTALQALAVLLNLSTWGDAMTDAKILEQTTFVPALFWAVGWALSALVALTLGLRSAWNGKTVRAAKYAQYRPSGRGG